MITVIRNIIVRLIFLLSSTLFFVHFVQAETIQQNMVKKLDLAKKKVEEEKRGTTEKLRQGELNTESEKLLLKTIIPFLTLFRREVCEDPQVAFDKYADIDTAKNLHDLGAILSPISDVSRGWQSFFGSSVAGITSLSEQIVLTMFYNPWADVALLTAWTKLGGTPKITQVKLVSGDEIRNTEIPLLQPQWRRTGDVPPPLSAIVENADTMQAFLNLYGNRPAWPAQQWPDKLPTLKTDHPKQDSKKIVGLFFSDNLASISALFHDPVYGKLKSSMEKIQQQLLTGKTDELMSRTSEMLDESRAVLSSLTPEYWKFARVVSFASNPKHAFIFLSSFSHPQLFVSFWFNMSDNDNPKLSRIDFFRYDLSFEEVDKLARKVGMKRPQSIHNENGGSL